MTTNNFSASLLRSIRGFAGYVTKTAKGYAPNSHLKNSIVSTVNIKGNVYTIITTATGPDARAREYGSGLWTRAGHGAKSKYTIKPKKSKVLVFPWDITTSKWSPPGNVPNENIPRTKDGRVILKSVEHPGVEAANNGKGYLGPAFRDARKVYKERIKKEGAQGIRLDMRSAFRATK